MNSLRKLVNSLRIFICIPPLFWWIQCYRVRILAGSSPHRRNSSLVTQRSLALAPLVSVTCLGLGWWIFTQRMGLCLEIFPLPQKSEKKMLADQARRNSLAHPHRRRATIGQESCPVCPGGHPGGPGTPGQAGPDGQLGAPGQGCEPGTPGPRDHS